MSDIRKILNAINENSVSTTSGSVSSVSQPILTQSRIEEEKPELPKVLEYGMWENSALVTGKKIKDSRKKSKVVKDVYDKGDSVKESKQHVNEGSSNAWAVTGTWTQRKYMREPMTTTTKVIANSSEEAKRKYKSYMWREHERKVIDMKVEPYKSQGTTMPIGEQGVSEGPLKRTIDIAASLGYSIKESRNGKIVIFKSEPSQLTIKAKLDNSSGKDMIYWEAGAAHDMISANEFPIFFKQLHQAHMNDIKNDQGVSEAEKNPHTSTLGKALYRDLSKQPKLSPQQVQRNKERWAQRQADKEQGVAEGSEDPSYKKGWELCNKDPSADPQHLFRKHGEGLDRNQFIKGFNDNAKSRGMRIHGDVRGDVDHSTLRYKEFKRDQGVAEGSDKNLNEMNPYLVQQGLEVVIDFLTKYPTATAVTAGVAGAAVSGVIIKKLVTKAWQNHKELEQLKQDILSWSNQKLHANKNIGRMGGKVAKIIQKEIERRKQNISERGVAEGLSKGNYNVGLEDIGKPVLVDGKSGYVLLSIGYSSGNGKLTAHILQPDTGSKGTYDLAIISKGQQGVAEGSDQELVKRQVSYWDQVAKEKKNKEREALKAKKAEYEKTPAGKAEKYWSQKGVAEGSGPQVGDEVYYGNRLVGWFKGYSKYGKIITEPNVDEMGDEYLSKDVYWDPQDNLTIKPKQGVTEAIPYALSAANANAEYKRTKTFVPRGYKGRVDIEVSGQEKYRLVMAALKKLAQAEGQHIEAGLSHTKMSIFSKTMDSDALNKFVDMALEEFDQGVAEEQLDEVAGAQKCWPGHRKVGTQPGTGKNAGKRVNKCKKI